MPIEDALLICLKRLRVSLSPVPLLTRVIQQHSDDVQQAAHHLQEEVEEAHSQTCNDKRRRSSDQIRAKQTKSRYRVPDVYLHQSAAHQTGTRATDTGKRLATDTAHCTSPNKGPNTIQHQTQSTEKTMERKKRKKESKNTRSSSSSGSSMSSDEQIVRRHSLDLWFLMKKSFRRSLNVFSFT